VQSFIHTVHIMCPLVRDIGPINQNTKTAVVIPSLIPRPSPTLLATNVTFEPSKALSVRQTVHGNAEWPFELLNLINSLKPNRHLYFIQKL